MCGKLQLCFFHSSIIFISTVFGGDAKILTYTSYEGGSVNIRCPYDPGYKDNTKYLCRGECSIRPLPGNKDIPIESGKSPKDQRFSLNDNKTETTFTITIKDLRLKDEGKYWCAVKTQLHRMDVYSEVFLSVRHDLVSHVSGVKGGQLSVQCYYDYGVINNDKFFCKGDDLSFCETSGVKVTRGKSPNGRFSLNDDTSARVFTVTITDLTEEDSGIYWCGNAVQRGSQPAHNKWISAINLTISEVMISASVTSGRTLHKPTTTLFHTTKPASTYSSSRPTISSSSPSSSLSSSSSAHSLSSKPQTSLMWIMMLLCIAMLMLCGFLLFIYFRRRKRNKELQLTGVARGSDGNLTNVQLGQTRVSVCQYEEIQFTNDPPIYSLPNPVPDEDDAPVYALAQNASNNLNYSSIRFTDHSARTSLDGQTSDYATVFL